MAKIEPYGEYSAILAIRRDERFGPVKQAMESFDGQRGVFRECGVFEAADDLANPAYCGEHRMVPPVGWPVVWVASGDLKDLEEVPAGTWLKSAAA